MIIVLRLTSKLFGICLVLLLAISLLPTHELRAQSKGDRCKSAKNKANCEAYFAKLDSGTYFPGSEAGDAYAAIRDYMEEKCREPEDDMIFGQSACSLLISHISSHKKTSSIAEKDWQGLGELLERICLSGGSCTSCGKAAGFILTKPEYENLKEEDLKKQVGDRILAIYAKGCVGGCNVDCESKRLLEKDPDKGAPFSPF